MKFEIPADQIDSAQARVDPLLDALRRESERLGPADDSALTYSPEAASE